MDVLHYFSILSLRWMLDQDKDPFYQSYLAHTLLAAARTWRKISSRATVLKKKSVFYYRTKTLAEVNEQQTLTMNVLGCMLQHPLLSVEEKAANSCVSFGPGLPRRKLAMVRHSGP